MDPAAPAYLTLLYHRVRLCSGTADPATLRPLLDAVLARTDLTATTRNLFLAERLQLAADLARWRASPCGAVCTKEADGCEAADWGYYGTGAGLFDGGGAATRASGTTPAT